MRDHTEREVSTAVTRIPVNLEQVDRERLRRAWSKRQLATRMGVTEYTVSVLYRNGWASPNLFEKLTNAFADLALHEVAERLMGPAE